MSTESSLPEEPSFGPESPENAEPFAVGDGQPAGAQPVLSWPEANESYLRAAVDVVRAALERRASELAERGFEDRGPEALATLEAAAAALPAPSALERLTAIFGLSEFERDIVLLTAGLEIDSSFAALCAAAQGNVQRDYPTLRLALDVLPSGNWGALSPAGSLRRFQLIDIGPGTALASSSLRLAERVLHYLFAVDYLDERLVGLLEPLPAAVELVPSHRQIAERIATLWEPIRDLAQFPLVQIAGGMSAERRAIAVTACGLLGRQIRALPAQLLPKQSKDLEAICRLWELEAALAGAALLIETDDLSGADRERGEALSWLAGRIAGAVIVSGDKRRPARARPLVTFDIERPSTAEQLEIWRSALGDAASSLDGWVEQLAAQFHLGVPAIRTAAAEAQARLEIPGNDVDLRTALWEACRSQARPQLDDLAQRIEIAAQWEELVLPAFQKGQLGDVAVHVRRRLKVYDHWGFASKGRRGLGISALFAGASGTGKTMGAEVIAGLLNLDLYRVDLSAVVSKYIGETEKNLRRIFDNAEAGGAILLFDEADALFGKRTAVKDSHDRHANIEVSYLLQRMESYRGLAILTTNLRSSLDVAFLRRIRFIVDFPFPDVTQRAEIWRRVFPDSTPTEGLEYERLAQLNVAGGNIRNIALNAAFLAAEDGEPVRMGHLLRAAQAEYAKLKKTMNPAETRGWEIEGEPDRLW